MTEDHEIAVCTQLAVQTVIEMVQYRVEQRKLRNRVRRFIRNMF